MNTTEQLAREVLDALSGGDIERAGPLVAEDFTSAGIMAHALLSPAVRGEGALVTIQPPAP
jgi:ketosteroid isomerase-like protein